VTAASRAPAATALSCADAPAFELPDGLVATGPPEARGLPRDCVRMLVASASEGLTHRRAYHLPAVLRPGDLLVLNTSDTLPAALRGVTEAGTPVEVHLSTVDPAAGLLPARALALRDTPWVVEIRRSDGRPGGAPSTVDYTGASISLAGGGRLDLSAPYPSPAAPRRLWTGRLRTPAQLRSWLISYGQPIRYGYVSAPWPLAAYRTTYADTPGSAEMPSAGRALTSRTFRRLRSRGVRTAGLVLHCGVSSVEGHEPPYAEWYSVPQSTVDAVAATRRDGGRVVAVGTTVVRALETAAGGALSGWTELVVTPERGVSTVDGLITGWHEPQASHLRLLSAVAGADLLCASYRAALDGGYRWHEFGDLHLILP
jgi:S-adenosylmethionine:tRNA ribosyltransferase-isomerase